MKFIEVRNARKHNLKNINVTIPKGKLTVVTGVSGSGKSTFAFDILYEEGRNRYLQSIGFFGQTNQEDHFDEITGLSPTISVEQRIIRQSNPRSVVGTRTYISQLLGQLFSLEGQMTCSRCNTTLDYNLYCEKCGIQESRLTPPYFSFNTGLGMCLDCRGRGYSFELMRDKIVPNKNKNVLEICRGLGFFGKSLLAQLSNFANINNIDLTLPFCRLSDEAQQFIYYGMHDVFEGLLPCIQRRMSSTVRARSVGETQFCSRVTCPICMGFRIGEEARRVTINAKHIGHLGNMSIHELKAFLSDTIQSGQISSNGKAIINLIIRRLHLLIELGLSHLSINRSLPSLSGGEIQRLFLMYHIESAFDSLTYIFDEPTSGLHEIEKELIIHKLRGIQQAGNTVIVVEHDPMMIKAADYVLELGPQAGEKGGGVVFQGSVEDMLQATQSITGKYLSKQYDLPRKEENHYRRVTDITPKLTLKNVSVHNLKNFTVNIPLGLLIGVTGVSGSGKSSLISDTLVPLLKQRFKKSTDINDDENDSEGCSELISCELEGYGELKGCIAVSQSPIGRHKTSIPASYIGIWDKIRLVFASQPLAAERGYSPGHFSFNSSDGQCEKCKGEGTVQLIGEVTRECSECNGRRYKTEILEVKYEDNNIFDILNSSITDAAKIFKNDRSIVHMLHTLERVGMGYLKLGQPTPSLSGGEAQRVKLAKELGHIRKSNMLYVLDEPTTGLGYSDISKLMLLVEDLTQKGNTVIVIEHDPEFLSFCDWIIELGPGGGDKGGYVIAQGSPWDLMNNKESIISKYLKL
ncbi:excinuclease ABC subunit UvrA [Paenibacillus sp. AN1007]|uniref:UvrABC system protein A n=1 Tax=Paenibacillus sp. AN1007 TaxID=3151385 RepID=A0AAU8N7R4_9BACL